MDVLIYLRAQGDRLAGIGCIAAGAVLLITGAIQMSRSATILSQLSYLGSACLIGLFLLVLGLGLLVTASLRDEWRKLDQIQTALTQQALAAAMSSVETDLREAVADGAQATPVTVLR